MRTASAAETIRLTNGQKAYTGTISHATVRDVDLIPSFLTWLACHDIEAHDKIMDGIVRDCDVELQALCSAYESANPDPDAVQQLYEDIYQAINNLMPEGWFFASHPGDGSDYGIWPTSLSDD